MHLFCKLFVTDFDRFWMLYTLYMISKISFELPDHSNFICKLLLNFWRKSKWCFNWKFCFTLLRVMLKLRVDFKIFLILLIKKRKKISKIFFKVFYHFFTWNSAEIIFHCRWKVFILDSKCSTLSPSCDILYLWYS